MALVGPIGRVVASDAAADAVHAADLVVNATTVGMGATTGSEMPVAADALHPGQHVVDIVYRPLETRPAAARLVVEAPPRSNGVPMLVHQAAVAFELWTGVPAPVAAMAGSVAHLLG